MHRDATFLIVLCAMLASAAIRVHADTEGETAYRFIPVDESISEPWHRTYLPDTPTPEDEPNAGADYINKFLQLSFDDRLHTSLVRSKWIECDRFLNWAVWGYLSPDSDYRGDERLVAMSRAWLEALLQRLATKPEDSKKAKHWEPNRISNSWSIQDYTIPALHMEAHPALADAIGRDLCDRYRQIVVGSIEDKTRPEQFNKLIEKADNYVNMATHPIALFVHGWLLTGEQKYLKMAHSIVAIMHRDQMPNGMYPYRTRMHGDRHIEFSTMYYRAIDTRALFMFWWASGSPMALECLQRGTPWYPLNLEPPYHFNDGPDVWWKDQWRTFWSMHVAMTAAATGDGENATIARKMAKDRVSVDQHDLVLGALAFQQMGKDQVASQPLRDDYVIHDPDIRGLRLRDTPWSSTFSVGSFTYTRASAMWVWPDQPKKYDALHMARPCVRVEPLERLSRYDHDYSILGPVGAAFDHALLGDDTTIAAAGTVYAPAFVAATWHDEVPEAPWRMTELWLMTPDGLIGLIDSVATQQQELRELNHQFRFILAKPRDESAHAALEDQAWRFGELTFRVWKTNFKTRVLERVRRVALNPNDRRDIQVSLTDQHRLPEQEAQALTTAQQEEARHADQLPVMHEVEKGFHRFSLVSVTPPGRETVREVQRLPHADLVGFAVTIDNQRYNVWMNPTGAQITLSSQGQGTNITLPPHQVKLLLISNR